MTPRVSHILELARDLSEEERDEVLGELATQALEGDPAWVADMQRRAQEARTGQGSGGLVDDVLADLERTHARTSA